MIALYDAVFGYIKVVVFHLMERIAIETVLGGTVKMQENTAEMYCKNRLEFSYLAIKSRHEVPGMP